MDMRNTLLAATLSIMLFAPRADAGIHLRRSSTAGHSSSVSMRKRLHVNDLIAEPGTAEVDWGTLYSYTTGALTLPSAIKFTPDGNSLYWGRTEYSVSFDSISSGVNTGTRSTQFSDRLSFAATSVVYDSEHFDIAVAPQVTTFLRNDSGLRLGATTIARYDGGGNSIAATAGWSAATTASDTNPAGVWDFGGGLAHHMASKGTLAKITPHVNLSFEKSTGFEKTLAAFAGVEYQLTERVAFDLSGQRFGVIGGGQDRQILLGLTVNLGKMH